MVRPMITENRSLRSSLKVVHWLIGQGETLRSDGDLDRRAKLMIC